MTFVYEETKEEPGKLGSASSVDQESYRPAGASDSGSDTEEYDLADYPVDMDTDESGLLCDTHIEGFETSTPVKGDGGEQQASTAASGLLPLNTGRFEDAPGDHVSEAAPSL